ncbi:hypothetical protein Slin15195_G062500 [Septoria linicola]|uniref:Uncharacterized protein n=1 Tax=Septoria linicola TaxID=215465 RepID=A0A9Q9AYF1_9PEZI|nr:hypothetical protein Slin14017_G112830 [Septoria linicola]USW52931.1 hypothetical protein Slin15195_G062500 [Septoria linicola]
MGNACTSIERCRRGSSDDVELPPRRIVVATRRQSLTGSPMTPPHRPDSILSLAAPCLERPSTSTSKGLPNFPLPRELRDYIYGYLLDAEEVKFRPHDRTRDSTTTEGAAISRASNRSCSTAHTYRFSTNILAVNKQIHAEASILLHSANTFIAISHRWPNLSILKHRYDVPILSENARHIRNSRVVSLRYSIRHPTRTRHGGVFMMIVRDFPQFTRMMQWLYFQTKVPMTLAMRRDDSSGFAEYIYPGELIPGPKVQLATSLHLHQTSRNLQAAIFKVVRHQMQLVLPGQTFDLRGPPSRAPEAPADRLSEYITGYCGNTEVRVEAMLWRMVDIALSLKFSADALLQQGEYSAAAVRYEWVFEGCTSWDFSHFLPSVLENVVARSAARMLYQIILDSVTTASMLYYYMKKPDTGMRLAASTGLVINLLNQIPTDLTVWTNAIDCYLLRHPSQDALITGLILIQDPTFLRAASIAMTMFSLLRPDDVQSETDLGFIDEILGSEEELLRYQRSMTKEEILSRLSVTAEPVKVFNSTVPEAVLLQRPKKLKGWWVVDDEGATGA